MVPRTFKVDAFWNDDAQIWVALSDDVPGLTIEARTFSFLRELVHEFAPELIKANRPSLAPLHIAEIEIRVVPEPALD